uniref:ATP-dependent DNA helicase n=1 Tax=Anopheles dirus TaxID=7168 RepID=A0A182NT38_9DIPT
MYNRYGLEALDRMVQDLMEVSHPFGGKVMLLAGDFRQILPVVPKGTDGQIIDQCIKKSPLWSQCTRLRLTVNMRVRTAPTVNHANELHEFAEFLLRIGEGRHDTFPGVDQSFAKIPRDLVVPSTANAQHDIQSLVGRIYPDIALYYRHPDFFSDRAILSPLNADVTTINDTVLQTIPGPVREYRSIDTLVNPEEERELHLPSEYLNSLNISGIPVHRLCLKRYAPVLLLRILNSSMRLSNGTQLQIVDMKTNYMD